jgi:Lipoprotein LpqB beta-propeller domain/Sporulation and spore germination
MASGSLAGPRRASWPAWPAASLAAVAAAIVVAGCATVPSGGAPRKVSGTSAQAQAYVLPEPPPPPTSARVWSPTNVVLGFLHASASYHIDPQAALDYLVPSVRGQWHPGAAVTVIADSPHLTPPPAPPAPGKLVSGSGPPGPTTVTVTAQQLATLSQSGQYEYAPATAVYTFSLEQVKNVWLIKGLPQGGRDLLLMQSDFEEVYQQRNLYFNSPVSAGNFSDLVPDPVYAPIEGSGSALNNALADNLVRGLFQDSSGWLAEPATTTAFPAGTTLEKLRISDQKALVDLGGAAGHAQPFVRDEMYEQLWATLTVNSGPGYSPPVAKSVELEINGQTVFTQDLPRVPIPPVSDGPEPLYFRDGSSVAELVRQGHGSQVVVHPGQLGGTQVVVHPGQLGGTQITAVASNPAKPARLAVAVLAGDGCAVYTGTVYANGPNNKPYQKHLLSTSGGACNSLSWDSSGNIWASSGQAIWVIQPGNSPVRVALPVVRDLAKKFTVLALRLAPDAVRAALLVQAKGSSNTYVLLAAVRQGQGKISLGQAVTAGTELTDPLALSWLSPYYLAVLADGGIYQVPLTGGAATELGLVPAGTQSLTTDGSEFVIATWGGRISMSPVSISHWTPGLAGRSPAYPG